MNCRDKHVQKCYVLSFLSNNPFVTQKEICERFNLSKDELIEKNKKIRETDWTRDYIINTGVGSKYWKNLNLRSKYAVQ